MKKTLMLTLIILILMPLMSAVNDFAYNRLYDGSQPVPGFNYSINVNTSDNWDTNIGVLSDVNSTQFENNGGILTITLSWLENFIQGVNITNPFDQDLNTYDNVSFVEVNATVGYFEDLFVSNSTLHVGGVSISEDNNTLQIEDGATINASFLTGDGSGLFNLDLDNISFSGGNISAVNILASTFYGSQFIGGNFTGFNFFGGDFHGTYDWTAEFPWFNFNGTYLDFNEYYFNQSVNNLIAEANFSIGNLTSLTLNGTTIYDWSDVNYTVSNGTVLYTTPSITGSFSIVLPEVINFEIAQITVTPSITTGSYRFAMYEAGTGETIDADIMTHKNTWDIFKSYPIDNQVSLNFSGVSPAKTFTVRIKYFQNVNN